jgi:hypothetical protein
VYGAAFLYTWLRASKLDMQHRLPPENGAKNNGMEPLRENSGPKSVQLKGEAGPLLSQPFLRGVLLLHSHGDNSCTMTIICFDGLQGGETDGRSEEPQRGTD